METKDLKVNQPRCMSNSNVNTTAALWLLSLQRCISLSLHQPLIHQHPLWRTHLTQVSASGSDAHFKKKKKCFNQVFVKKTCAGRAGCVYEAVKHHTDHSLPPVGHWVSSCRKVLCKGVEKCWSCMFPSPHIPNKPGGKGILVNWSTKQATVCDPGVFENVQDGDSCFIMTASGKLQNLRSLLWIWMLLGNPAHISCVRCINM